MKPQSIDFGTQFLRLILTILGSEHRTRVTVGLVLGMILWGSEDYLAAVFVTSAALSQLPTLGKVPSLAVGIGVAFSPLVFRKRVLPESYRTMFAIIDEAYANGTLTKSQHNLAYYTVIQKAVATFDPQRRPDFGKLASDTLAQVRGEPPATAA